MVRHSRGGTEWSGRGDSRRPRLHVLLPRSWQTAVWFARRLAERFPGACARLNVEMPLGLEILYDLACNGCSRCSHGGSSGVEFVGACWRCMAWKFGGRRKSGRGPRWMAWNLLWGQERTACWPWWASLGILVEDGCDYWLCSSAYIGRDEYC